jgi:hypothetical protein
MRKWMWAVLAALPLAVAGGLDFGLCELATGQRRGLCLPDHRRGTALPALLSAERGQVSGRIKCSRDRGSASERPRSSPFSR